LCHPILIHLFNQETSGTNLKEYIDSYRPGKGIVLPGGFRFPFKELLYQWKKYRFLKRNRFFKIPVPINLNGRVFPETIAASLPKIKQVIFETTEDCNLSCTYCTYSRFYINKERGRRKMSTADAVTTLKHVLSVRDKDADDLIVSFYGGEPLKNIRFIKEVVAFLKESYGDRYTFKFTMTSNGLLLSKHADFLEANNFDVSVSLDGDAKANSFRLLPGKQPSYDRVIRNLDFIKDRYPDYFNQKISFLTVLHNRNSFAEVHDFFKKMYGKTPLTSLISTTNLTKENKEEFSGTFLEGFRNTIQDKDVIMELFTKHPNVKELANTIEKYTGIVFKNHFQIISRVNGNEGTKEFVPTATCLPFSLRVFQTADGTLLPCEHISRNFVLGCLKNDKIEINDDTIAGLFNQCFDKIRSLCNRCFLADNCKECMFNTNMESEQPECEYFSDESKFKALLVKNFSVISDDFSIYTRLLEEAFDEK